MWGHMILKNGELKMVTDLDYIKEMFEEHQKRNDEQFAALKEYLLLKIESDNCQSCSMTPKVKELEGEIKIISNRQYIIGGAILVITYIAPHILTKLFP
jgi:hypothetical protein